MQLTFNLDFYDMFFNFRNKPMNATKNGYYEQEDLENLIGKAVGSGFSIINFRTAVCGKAFHRSKIKEPAIAPPEVGKTIEMYDPLEVAIKASHDAGAECYVWITPFDDYGLSPEDPLASEEGMAQRSSFAVNNPELQLKSRDGKDQIWGEYCFGHPEVKDYWLAYVKELLEYHPDGIFFSNRTHSNRLIKQREYGFNEPTIKRYKELYNADPRDENNYDLAKFSKILGEFYTDFLELAAKEIHGAGKKVMAGVSWRRDGLIAARLGLLDKCFFQWERWLSENIVDHLVIGGDAATGKDPEHCLAYFETEADSCNPDYFKKIKTDAKVHRWLTFFGWNWSSNAQKTSDNSTFNEETIKTMLDKLKKTTLDGLVCHEAMNIEFQDLWKIFA